MGRIIGLTKKSYHSSKIAVGKGSIYSDEKINSFVNMGFDEILKIMEEGKFKKAVDKSYSLYEGFYLVEKILNDYLSDIYSKVFLSASKDNRVLFEEYYLKYQIHNLMVLIRCKISNEEDITPYLIGDSRKKSKFVKAYEMTSTEDAIVYICKKLRIDEVLVLEKYKESIFELENYLYKVYYDRLSKFNFRFNHRDERSFVKFVRKYIDLINSRTFSKISREDSKIKFSEVFVVGGSLPLSFFENLDFKNKSSYQERMIQVLNFDSNEEFLSTGFYDKKISEHKKSASSVFNKSQFGSPFYAFRFLFDVEREVSKLRILLKAKTLGLTSDEVRDLLWAK